MQVILVYSVMWSVTDLTLNQTLLENIILVYLFCSLLVYLFCEKKSKRKVHEVPQSQTAALPRHQEEEETDKSKQAQIEQTYEKN